MPQVDRVEVRSITDGDTLTMALQAGQLDAVQGLPYASLELFADENQYTISSADTSRVFFGAYNYETEALQDIRVRQAIAMGPLTRTAYGGAAPQQPAPLPWVPFPSTPMA